MLSLIKRIILVLLLSLGIGSCSLVALIVYIFVDAHLDNNQILQKDITAMQSIQHPANTFSVIFQSGVYRSPGNGTHCHYFVAEIRRFFTSKNDIKDFYHEQHLIALFLENEEFSQYVPYGFNKLENWDLPTQTSIDNLYLIYTLKADFDNYHKNTLDLRCH